MSLEQRANRIDLLLSHVWMVRTFIKHSDESSEVEELTEIYRDLYDYSLALGVPLKDRDWDQYMKIAAKKLKRLKGATDLFCQLQPEISEHTNFVMAATSLRLATDEIIRLVQGPSAESDGGGNSDE